MIAFVITVNTIAAVSAALALALIVGAAYCFFKVL